MSDHQSIYENNWKGQCDDDDTLDWYNNIWRNHCFSFLSLYNDLQGINGQYIIVIAALMEIFSKLAEIHTIYKGA